MRQQFLLNEIWVLCFAGAFQRAGVYVKPFNEETRKKVREGLRNYVDNELVPRYTKDIPDDNEHINNIKDLMRFSVIYNKYLANGALNFGVSQKLLNLHLKYRWCLGYIEEPPHFPVDRIIQNRLKVPHLVAWTQMKDEKAYMGIIDFAKTQLKNHECISLAELELKLFNRRS